MEGLDLDAGTLVDPGLGHFVGGFDEAVVEADSPEAGADAFFEDLPADGAGASGELYAGEALGNRREIIKIRGTRKLIDN